MNKLLLPFIISATLLVGCGGANDSNSSSEGSNDEQNKTPVEDNTPVETPDDDNSPSDSYTSISGIDGSTGYAYFDLDTGKTLELTDDQAATNTEWDIAFYGTSIILNGDHSGPGDVKAYFTGNNDEFYDSAGKAVKDAFVNATPQSELADFIAVTADDIPADSEFISDSFETIFGNDFYVYNQNHSITQKDDQDYLVSQNEGLYQVRVTDLSNLNNGAPSYSITEFTLGVKFKGENDADFSEEQLVVLPECDTNAYIDLSAYSHVIASDEWDLNIQCNKFQILLGDGVTAQARNDEGDWQKALQYAGTEYAHYYLKPDGAETVFKDKNTWYVYNIDGGNKIWSQYGVYLISTGSVTYKFQITSYYKLNDDGTLTSRNMSFIYQAL